MLIKKNYESIVQECAVKNKLPPPLQRDKKNDENPEIVHKEETRYVD